MTTIVALAQDQVLTAMVSPKLACNNRNTVKLHVTFSSEWNSYTARSAVFATSVDPTPYEEVLTNGECIIPSEVLADEGLLYIFARGVNASTNSVKATTPLAYKVLPGTPSLIVSAPTADVYHQLLTANALMQSRLSTAESSVTVDSEVIGIRTGADGKTYLTAGDAVRKQTSLGVAALSKSGIYSDIRYTLPGGNGDEFASNVGYIDLKGEFVSTDAWNSTGFIDISNLVDIECNLVGLTTVASAAFYDGNKKFISAVFATTNYLVLTNINPPSDAKYARFTMIYSSDTQYVRIQRVNAERIISPLQGKAITATGDSITIATASAPNGNFVKLIADKYGMLYENKGIWGSVLPKSVTVDGTTLPSILETIDTMRADADYIILSGGINDFTYIQSGKEQFGKMSSGFETFDETTYCGAFESMLKKAVLKWKGKKILFVIEHKMASLNSYVGMEIEKVYLPETISILEKWGIPYVDLYHETPALGLIPELRDQYTWDSNGDGVGDGWHPTRLGYELFYVPKIEAKLKTI